MDESQYIFSAAVKDCVSTGIAEDTCLQVVFDSGFFWE